MKRVYSSVGIFLILLAVTLDQPGWVLISASATVGGFLALRDKYLL